MNKITSSNSSNDEMLDDYSEQLTPSHLKKAVRGKYAEALVKNNDSIVKITDKNGARYVNMKTLEVEALVNNEGHVTVEVPSSLKTGKYKAVLIIEQPTEKD